MGDLTTDAAPMGGPPSPAAPPARRRGPRAPLVYNIANSKGVHIGPVFHHHHHKEAALRRRRPFEEEEEEEGALPKEDLDALLRSGREVEEADKAAVSEHLGSRWRAVARLMGLSGGQIDNLRADHRRAVDRAHELLDSWHDRMAREATLAALAALLVDAAAHSALRALRP